MSHLSNAKNISNCIHFTHRLNILYCCTYKGGVFGAAASQRSHSGVVEASTTGRKGRGGGGHTAELSGARRPHGGGAKERQWVCRSDVGVVGMGHRVRR